MSSADSLVYAGILDVLHGADQRCLSTMVNLKASESPWLNASHTLIGFADNLIEPISTLLFNYLIGESQERGTRRAEVHELS